MARRHLRVDRIERADHLAHQPDSRAVCSVEAQMIGAEGADQRAHPVGILDVEMRDASSARAPRIDGVGQRRAGLQAHPFVQHQRIAAEAVMEMGEGVIAQGDFIRVSAARPAIMSVMLEALR